MPEDPGYFYCERSGEAISLYGTAPEAHYCVGCRLYMCPACWDAVANLCVTCASDARTHPATAPGVEPMLEALRATRAELDIIGEPERDSTWEGKLLRVKARSLATAIANEFGRDRAPQATDPIPVLVPEVEGGTSSEPTVAMENPEEVDEPFAASARRSRLPHLNLPALSLRPLTSVAVGVSLLAVVMLTLAQPRDRAVAPLAPSEEGTPEEEVAGGAPSTSPPPSHAARGTEAFTFDELVMGNPLPEEWRIGEGGSAEVAAVPNAIDRSLRLAARDGDPTILCRELAAVPARLAVDLLAADWAGTAVVLDLDGAPIGFAVTQEGQIEARAGRTVSLDAPLASPSWQQVVLEVDDLHSTISVGVAPRANASSLTREELPAVSQLAGGAVPHLCISSPSVPDGELFVDNLTITY